MATRINPLARMSSAKPLSRRLGSDEQEPAFKSSLGAAGSSFSPDTPKLPKQGAIQEAAYKQATDLAEMRAQQAASNSAVKDAYEKTPMQEFVPMDPTPFIREQEAYKKTQDPEFKPYPRGQIGVPSQEQKPYFGEKVDRPQREFPDGISVIGPVFTDPRGASDLESYMSMSRAAQMGYKKGGAVKANSNSRSTSGRASGYANKGGKLNLGSSRVSTALKSKKNPNF